MGEIDAIEVIDTIEEIDTLVAIGHVRDDGHGSDGCNWLQITFVVFSFFADIDFVQATVFVKPNPIVRDDNVPEFWEITRMYCHSFA